MSGMLQHEDHKSEAELVSAGGSKSQLLNDTKIYVTAKGINETLDDAITLGKIGGGGSGGVNYVTNNDFEVDTTGWYIYNDGASATPVDGIGGTITSNYLTIARTTTAGQILRGNASGKLSKTANNAQGWGLGYPIVIAAADKCKPLQFKISYLTLDANYSYANDDIRAWVYDVDNSQLIAVTPYQWDGSGAFLGEFQSTTSLNYRILLHVATTNANAYDIVLDDVSVGPATLVYGSLQDRQYDLTVTGTASWVTNRAKGIPYKTRDGAWRLRFNIFGTTSSTASVSITVAGITSIATYEQAVSESNYGGTHLYQYINPNSGQIDISGSTPTTKWFCSGDIELASMPTWAVDSYPVQYGDQYDGRVVNFASSITSAPTGSFSGAMERVVYAVAKDSHSAYSNGVYTVKVAGDYPVSASVGILGSGGTYTLLGIYKNGVAQHRVEFPTVNNNFANPVINKTLPNCNVGDNIEIKTFTTMSTPSYGDVGYNSLSIYRLAGPANITKSEQLVCCYNQSSAQSIPNDTITKIVYNNKVRNTHEGCYDPSTGIFTAPFSGDFHADYGVCMASGASWGGGDVLFLGLNKYSGGTETSVSRAYRTMESSSTVSPYVGEQASGTVYLNKGDQIYINIYIYYGSSLALIASASDNYFHIYSV